MPAPAPPSVADALAAREQAALARVADGLGPVETAALRARLRIVRPDLARALSALFGEQAAPLADRVVDRAVDAAARRPVALRARDRERESDPGWFLSQEMVGYVCYVDRFAGSLTGVLDRLDHLQELGVTYLHLMPLLQPRDGENDGGYAVEDYGAVDRRLGTMEDLRRLADALHERGMSLCIDLVVNHTADTHAWARAAVGGDPAYGDRYLSFPDRTLPDAYEQALPEVFPDTAPGSFTREPTTGRWFWTTFHSWQWDLDHSAPGTFEAMLDAMLFLLDQGADVLRLDAVPFLWKRLGTDCQNQPEVHLLVQAFRALVRVAAPGVLFKAEAIVGPDLLVRYLGGHDVQHPECQLAYHNQLMVQLWSAVASRDTRLLAHALRRMRPTPVGTGWVTYLRGHDDIGWAIADEDAWAVGADPGAHRRFLADFYAGRFPGSFARGADFQVNPRTGDVRTSGTTASLCGIEQALDLGDAGLLDSALRRFALLHAVLLSYPGIPLLFSGDELALRNDAAWAQRPGAGRDNRWMHRPHLPPPGAAPDAVGARALAVLRGLTAARAGLTALRGDGTCTVLDSDDPAVLVLLREHPRARPVLAVANVAERPARLAAHLVARLGGPAQVASASDPPRPLPAGALELAGLSWAWLRPAS